MKRILLQLLILVTTVSFTSIVHAQTGLLPDQNPDFALSRSKYMKIADSVNTLHSTTVQETYKAIDYLVDKREAREQRRLLNRQYRNSRSAYEFYYGSPYNNYYPARYYTPYRNSYYNRGYYRYRASDLFWNTLPLLITAGLFCH